MTDRHATKKLLKIIIISIILLCFLGYTAYEIQKLVFGPKIIITFPQNGSLISTSSIKITGVAKNIKDISLNDRKIFVDEAGNFEEELLLFYGYNAISIKANDKFSRNTEKIIEIIYK